MESIVIFISYLEFIGSHFSYKINSLYQSYFSLLLILILILFIHLYFNFWDNSVLILIWSLAANL